MKKLLVLLLVVTLILGSMTLAYAGDKRDGDWEYSTDGASATITRYLGDDAHISIPSVLGGLPVTTIGSMAMQLLMGDDVISPKTIKVPDTVKVIENANFVGYNGLMSIELPEGLQSIGDDCFSYCTSLATIRLPASLTGLGAYLFDSCDNITVEVYPGSLAETVCRAEGIPYRIVGAEKPPVTATQEPFVIATQAPQAKPGINLRKFTMQTFDEFHFRRNQMLDIYTGPGYNYYRSANGKAAASTNAQIFIFGWEENWLLVLYGTGNGKSRYGYANKSDFDDDIGGRTLDFANLDASIATSCFITDCMPDDHSILTTLSPGTAVKFLAYNPDFDWAYIEVNADIGLMRGFVPFDCLSY